MSSDDGDAFPVNVGYPIYERGSYRRDSAPIMKVQRYVAPRIIWRPRGLDLSCQFDRRKKSRTPLKRMKPSNEISDYQQ